jgi:hypothetical protein
MHVPNGSRRPRIGRGLLTMRGLYLEQGIPAALLVLHLSPHSAAFISPRYACRTISLSRKLWALPEATTSPVCST